jgi:hypothetical protein
VVVAGCHSSGSGNAMDMSMALVAECDVLKQTGCSGGKKCTIGLQDGQPRDLCFDVISPAAQLGAACQQLTGGNISGDNCAAGLVCTTFASQTKCRVPCYLRSDCPTGSACIAPTASTSVRSVAGQDYGLAACVPTSDCDPIAKTGCGVGQVCYFSAADDVGISDLCLMPTGNGMAGDDCKKARDCAAGFKCSGLGFCRRLCYYEPPDGGAGLGTCPPGEGACTPFYFSTDEYGTCGD